VHVADHARKDERIAGISRKSGWRVGGRHANQYATAGSARKNVVEQNVQAASVFRNEQLVEKRARDPIIEVVALIKFRRPADRHEPGLTSLGCPGGPGYSAATEWAPSRPVSVARGVRGVRRLPRPARVHGREKVHRPLIVGIHPRCALRYLVHLSRLADFLFRFVGLRAHRGRRTDICGWTPSRRSFTIKPAHGSRPRAIGGETSASGRRTGIPCSSSRAFMLTSTRRGIYESAMLDALSATRTNNEGWPRRRCFRSSRRPTTPSWHTTDGQRGRGSARLLAWGLRQGGVGILVGLLLLPVGIMAQEAGDLDTSFGGDGKVTTALGDTRSLLTRPADFALARYESGLVPRVGPPSQQGGVQTYGWRTFNIPRAFKNQGDCIRFVNTGR
jgi:hypothetical protein